MTDPQASAGEPTPPAVSVVVAVYNAMPYLTECLDSLVGQTLGIEQMEIVAVEDKSTDASLQELRRFADRHPQVRVVARERNSGGPSVPRNQGIDQARGRYVFLMDADDYLGDEALARMVAMADEQDSDVVVGKMAGVGGRRMAEAAFRHAPRADLYTSQVYRSLGPTKLYRRSLLDDNHIRFDTDLWLGEDQVFVTDALLSARTISVVGDYTCYYARARDDGQNLSKRPKSAQERVVMFERLLSMVDERVSDPRGRRTLLGRHFRNILGKTLLPVIGFSRFDPGTGPRYDEAYTAEILASTLDLFDRYWSDDFASEIGPYERLMVHCLTSGKLDELLYLGWFHRHRADVDLLIEGGRAYRTWPFFRFHDAPEERIPDDVYDVTDTIPARATVATLTEEDGTLSLTGNAVLRLPGHEGAPDVEVQLRHRVDGTSRALSTNTDTDTEGPDASWSAQLALSEPGDGVWALWARLRGGGLVRDVPLTAPADAAWPMSAHRHTPHGGRYWRALRTRGGLGVLDIGGETAPLDAVLMVQQQQGDDELFTFVVSAAGGVRVDGARASLSLLGRIHGAELTVPARRTGEDGEHATFDAVVAPRRLTDDSVEAPDIWDLRVVFEADGLTSRVLRLHAARGDSQVPERGRTWSGPDPANGATRYVTPYLTARGYAAIDGVGKYFGPGK
ncbi:glycosyltransferase [Streptomyces sp. NBC_01016]|uniref:glycosyltransferase family 2 protein n=1 Tax=Streptomyces sp. NBC_01016 TaxID=2903720 RepID=UPI002252C3B5|nr:glycosyltransferase family 2 protein [Streptomyces sp. NBC_01016]MCX4830779.1 glycosyltransferase [Streptomyces sp. NBC_01016]